MGARSKITKVTVHQALMDTGFGPDEVRDSEEYARDLLREIGIKHHTLPTVRLVQGFCEDMCNKAVRDG